MTHLLILCEGHLEAKVLYNFLRPYWEQRFQTAEIQRYSGNGELRQNFKADAEIQMKTEPDSSVLCLVDLYKEPFDLYNAQMDSVDGFNIIQLQMYAEIDSRFHPRFGGFPVVMELETWLLADSEVQKQLQIDISTPEQHFHPTAYLEKLYQERKQQYGKIIEGTSLFGKAHAKRVYEDNCPHFNLLIDWLVHPPAAIPDTRTTAIREKQAAWSKQRDQLYDSWQKLEASAQTDDDLELAIQAEQKYNAFLLTYPHVFQP